MKEGIKPLAVILLFLIIWQILALSEEVSKYFSSPYEVLTVLLEEVRNPEFWTHVSFSYINITLGYVLGNLLGAIVGIVLWLRDSLGKIFNPILFLLSSIPIFAIAPMSILWWGSGDVAKVIIVFLHVFFVAVFYAYKNVGNIKDEYYAFFKFVGVNDLNMFIHIIIPSASLWFLPMLKLTVGFAVLGEFVAEFIVSDKGIGHYIIRATGLYDVPRVIVGIFFLLTYSTLTALIIDFLHKTVLRKYIEWRE